MVVIIPLSTTEMGKGDPLRRDHSFNINKKKKVVVVLKEEDHHHCSREVEESRTVVISVVEEGEVCQRENLATEEGVLGADLATTTSSTSMGEGSRLGLKKEEEREEASLVIGMRWMRNERNVR